MRHNQLFISLALISHSVHSHRIVTIFLFSFYLWLVALDVVVVKFFLLSNWILFSSSKKTFFLIYQKSAEKNSGPKSKWKETKKKPRKIFKSKSKSEVSVNKFGFELYLLNTWAITPSNRNLIRSLSIRFALSLWQIRCCSFVCRSPSLFLCIFHLEIA